MNVVINKNEKKPNYLVVTKLDFGKCEKFSLLMFVRHNTTVVARV